MHCVLAQTQDPAQHARASAMYGADPPTNTAMPAGHNAPLKESPTRATGCVARPLHSTSSAHRMAEHVQMQGPSTLIATHTSTYMADALEQGEISVL